MAEERKLILKMLQENRITIDEADQLLAALAPSPAAGASSPPPPKEDNIFQKAGPKVDQLMGTLSSMFDTVSQQMGPGLEKHLEGWFQQRAAKTTAATAAADGSTAAEVLEQEEVIPVAAGCKKIKCLHTLGNLIVEGHEGQNIQVTLEKHFTGTHVEDKLKLEDLRLHSQQEDETLLLDLKGAEGFKQADQVAIHLRLKVPASLDLELSTEQSDIILSQLQHAQGQVHLQSQSGDLELHNLALKQIDAKTTSGNIQADQASEHLNLQTQSGDIRLKGSVFEGSIRSQSGSIQVEASIQQVLKVESRSGDLSMNLIDGKGRLDLQSQSGDIELTGTLQQEAVLNAASGDLQCDLVITPAASVSLTTHSGDLDLILRPESQCRLDIEAQSGDVECRLELQQSEKTAHTLQGVLGNGEGTLRARTNSGDVLIS